MDTNTSARNLWIGAAVLAVIVIAGLVYIYAHRAPAVVPNMQATTVSYSCAQGTITAAYATSTVALVLSDGRSLTLPQAESGSGIRYEQTVNGSDVDFQSKGNDAFLEENGSVTYADCVAGTTTPTAGGTTFTDGSKTFSFSYAAPLTVAGGGVGYSTDWMVNATTSGLVLATVSLPKSFEPSTNFGDAKLTVGTSADPSAVATCLTYNPSGGPSTPVTTTTINGTTYHVFHASDAGAGNFYETTSYRTLRNSQCYVIEYTIHTSNIQNYPADSGITAYDESKVTNLLESVVRSFTFLGPDQATSPPTSVVSPAVPQTPAMQTVTDNGDISTVHLAVGGTFLLDLGTDLKWSNVQISPSSVVAQVSGAKVPAGAQGVFKGIAPGTATLTATGAPNCAAGQACPQFLREFNLTIVVGS